MSDPKKDWKETKHIDESRKLLEWSQEKPRQAKDRKRNKIIEKQWKWDSTKTWIPTNEYRDNYDKIFRKDKDGSTD